MAHAETKNDKDMDRKTDDLGMEQILASIRQIIEEDNEREVLPDATLEAPSVAAPSEEEIDIDILYKDDDDLDTATFDDIERDKEIIDVEAAHDVAADDSFSGKVGEAEVTIKTLKAVDKPQEKADTQKAATQKVVKDEAKPARQVGGKLQKPITSNVDDILRMLDSDLMSEKKSTPSLQSVIDIDFDFDEPLGITDVLEDEAIEALDQIGLEKNTLTQTPVTSSPEESREIEDKHLVDAQNQRPVNDAHEATIEDVAEALMAQDEVEMVDHIDDKAFVVDEKVDNTHETMRQETLVQAATEEPSQTKSYSSFAAKLHAISNAVIEEELNAPKQPSFVEAEDKSMSTISTETQSPESQIENQDHIDHIEDQTMTQNNNLTRLTKDSLMGDDTAHAASNAFNALSENVRISRGEGATLENMVQEMMKPMLREWMDQNLSRIVEEKVEEEVRRLARRS